MDQGYPLSDFLVTFGILQFEFLRIPAIEPPLSSSLVSTVVQHGFIESSEIGSVVIFIFVLALELLVIGKVFDPWVLLGFSVLVGSSPWVDLLGMVAGHAYYFLEDVYPIMTGRRLLRTPAIIKSMFSDEAVVVPPPANARVPAQGNHRD
eukprot:Gb_10516 [translate_table: standard]